MPQCPLDPTPVQIYTAVPAASAAPSTPLCTQPQVITALSARVLKPQYVFYNIGNDTLFSWSVNTKSYMCLYAYVQIYVYSHIWAHYMFHNDLLEPFCRTKRKGKVKFICLLFKESALDSDTQLYLFF